MSSYDRFISKNIFASYVGLCSAPYDPSFFSSVSLKFGQLAKFFWANGTPMEFEIYFFPASEMISRLFFGSDIN